MRNRVINYDIDSDFTLDNTPTMERIRHKRKLILDTNSIFIELSKNQNIYPKGYYKKLQNEIKKDVMKGIKVINKKNPVFIEMPTLEQVGNGQIRERYSNADPPDDENITVNLPTVISSNTDLPT